MEGKGSEKGNRERELIKIGEGKWRKRRNTLKENERKRAINVNGGRD
jgi:hypothetical protein